MKLYLLLCAKAAASATSVTPPRAPDARSDRTARDEVKPRASNLVADARGKRGPTSVSPISTAGRLDTWDRDAERSNLCPSNPDCDCVALRRGQTEPVCKARGLNSCARYPSGRLESSDLAQRVAATPRPRRGYAAEKSRGGRGYSVETSRGTAAASDADVPWRRVAAPATTWIFASSRSPRRDVRHRDGTRVSRRPRDSIGNGGGRVCAADRSMKAAVSS